MADMHELSFDPEKRNGFVINGMTLPPLQASQVPWEKHITDIQALELRDTDVFICAYPKAGTHWLWEVTHMLLSGKVQYETRTKENLMIEFVTKEMVDSLLSPRILNTHLYFSILPVQQMKEKKVKVLHIYRNPKDTVVSMYFHFRQVFPRLRDYTLLQFLQLFLRDDMVFGSYFIFLQQMEEFVKGNPDIPVFHLSFEEMKKEPLGSVRRLAEFLGVKASDDLCQDITEACSFHNMKKIDETKELPTVSELAMSKDTALYRKGEPGDWKNYLTVTMSEMIDQAVRDKLAGSMFTVHSK